MNTTYWNLFWITGMPEAWLMSRNGVEPRQTGSELRMGSGQELSRPLAGFQPRLSGNVPGGPEGLY